jgi:hypothetical protein
MDLSQSHSRENTTLRLFGIMELAHNIYWDCTYGYDGRNEDIVELCKSLQLSSCATYLVEHMEHLCEDGDWIRDNFVLWPPTDPVRLFEEEWQHFGAGVNPLEFFDRRVSLSRDVHYTRDARNNWVRTYTVSDKEWWLTTEASTGPIRPRRVGNELCTDIPHNRLDLLWLSNAILLMHEDILLNPVSRFAHRRDKLIMLAVSWQRLTGMNMDGLIQWANNAEQSLRKNVFAIEVDETCVGKAVLRPKWYFADRGRRMYVHELHDVGLQPGDFALQDHSYMVSDIIRLLAKCNFEL